MSLRRVVLLLGEQRLLGTACGWVREKIQEKTTHASNFQDMNACKKYKWREIDENAIAMVL